MAERSEDWMSQARRRIGARRGADPADPFHFWPARMHRQLNAGYVKLRPDGGLPPLTPDDEDLEPGDVERGPAPETERLRTETGGEAP